MLVRMWLNLNLIYVQNILLCDILLFMLISLILIIMQKNPVYAVFSFILTAMSTFSFLLLIGAEFFALLILIIYTGVITVLFLFIVIRANVREINIGNRYNYITAMPIFISTGRRRSAPGASIFCYLLVINGLVLMRFILLNPKLKLFWPRI